MLPAKLTATDAPVPPAERIAVIDTLRGIALLGMMVVHFSYSRLPDKTGLNAIAEKGIMWFADGRFYTMFAILFGVGFAIQLQKAANKGVNFVPQYLRRLLMLLGFGVIAEVFFGYHILVEYSLCGFFLLLVRNWSTKALIALALVVALSASLYSLTYNAIYAAVNGVENTKTMTQKQGMRSMAYWVKKRQLDSLAGTTTSYSTAVTIRAKGMVHRYSRVKTLVFMWLGEPFLFFLIGLLAVRAGIFRETKRHLRLIIGFMIFGAASWALFFWKMPLFTLSANYQYPAVPYVAGLALQYLSYGFTILKFNWLAFTYIGAVLLVLPYFKGVQPFPVFSLAGRMALTFYMVQTAFINLLFAKSVFGAGNIPTAMAPVYALMLFGGMVLFSRWWLAQYQYGPLEWLWRSFTYWKVQPLRKSIPVWAEGDLPQELAPAGVKVLNPISGSLIPGSDS